MDIPWGLPIDEGVDASPPWVQHSRLRTQQELCAKRFLRFASLHHVHATVALWAAALWFAGLHPLLACAPMAYFTGVVALGRRWLPSSELEHVSLFILVLNALNALHLLALCVFQGEIILTSPLFVFVPLSRALFGFFTQEVQCHLALSTALAAASIGYNCKLVVVGEMLLIIVAGHLLELTIVVLLLEGPCGYEEAIVHLAQRRAQHQLIRSEAAQRIDLEREEFSGQLLAIATQVIAELTAAVQRASEPVLNMLQSACATGTKSSSEAERIGRIGESLKEEVAQILRYKTQVAWTRLQERAKERTQRLREFAAAQEAASEAMMHSLHQQIGGSLAHMHELELDAETSLDQLIQSEINRAMETVDARMDLVKQSAQAMERRVSDTVEVLLSLLKYFRSRSGPTVVTEMRLALSCRATEVDTTTGTKELLRLSGASSSSSSGSRSRSSSASSGKLKATSSSTGKSTHSVREPSSESSSAGGQSIGCGVLPSSPSQSRLPSIQERGSLPGISGNTLVDDEQPAVDAALDTAGSDAPDRATQGIDGRRDQVALGCEENRIDAPSQNRGDEERASMSCASDRNEEVWSTGDSSDVAHGDGYDTDMEASGTRAAVAAEAEVSEMPPSFVSGDRCGFGSDTLKAMERHPLFATRLVYETEEFFWTWASSRDFRAEMDALKVWQRAHAMNSNANAGSASEQEHNFPGVGVHSGTDTAASSNSGVDGGSQPC